MVASWTSSGTYPGIPIPIPTKSAKKIPVVMNYGIRLVTLPEVLLDFIWEVPSGIPSRIPTGMPQEFRLRILWDSPSDCLWGLFPEFYHGSLSRNS